MSFLDRLFGYGAPEPNLDPDCFALEDGTGVYITIDGEAVAGEVTTWADGTPTVSPAYPNFAPDADWRDRVVAEWYD